MMATNEQVPASLADLNTAAKAVYDEVKELLDARFKGHEAEVTARLTKVLHQEFTKELDALRAELKGMMSLMATSHLGGMKTLLEAVKQLPTPQVTVTVPADAIQVKQLPAEVTVNVPENAIQVKQLPSTVIVNEKAFNLNVSQPAPVVNLPKGAIEIKQLPATVNLPEGAIQVSVQHKSILESPPRKTKTEKSILYDPSTGRPAKVVEEVTEE